MRKAIEAKKDKVARGKNKIDDNNEPIEINEDEDAYMEE